LWTAGSGGRTAAHDLAKNVTCGSKDLTGDGLGCILNS
jgi:hypothetical protein